MEGDRDTHCTLSDAVVWERSWDALQETIERPIPVQQYDADAVAVPLATPPAVLQGQQEQVDADGHARQKVLARTRFVFDTVGRAQ